MVYEDTNIKELSDLVIELLDRELEYMESIKTMDQFEDIAMFNEKKRLQFLLMTGKTEKVRLLLQKQVETFRHDVSRWDIIKRNLLSVCNKFDYTWDID